LLKSTEHDRSLTVAAQHVAVNTTRRF